MIWFRSANSHTGLQLHRCIRGRTDGSVRLRANLLQKPLALGGASTDEYTDSQTITLLNGIDFINSVENEHCLELVAALELPVVKSAIIDFAGKRVTIKRVDRTSGRIVYPTASAASFEAAKARMRCPTGVPSFNISVR
jgi:hypothetical protein